MLPNSDENEALRRLIAQLGAGPFHHQVIQSPWSTIRDVPVLHANVKSLIVSTLSGCQQQEAVRCLTIVAPSGYGKTHLLAWTRQQIDQFPDAVFVYVSPYTPGSPGSPDPNQHLIRAVIGSIMYQSQRQRGDFERAVRECLVRCYDLLISGGPRRRVRQILGVGGWMEWLFNRNGLRIGGRAAEDQLTALRRVLGRRAFLQHAFAEMQSSGRQHPPELCLDWDTFVASCLLTCGDSAQRWHAREWFLCGPTPLDVLRQNHLDHPCGGADKIRNGLFTLQCLSGKSFCLAFDQIEETFGALFGVGTDSAATQFAHLFGTLIRNICTMRGFCLLFNCQLSVWQSMVPHAPPMLVDRMVDRHGAQMLLPLNDHSAGELIRQSMRSHVWDELDRTPPDAEGLFPFTRQEVCRFRNQGNDVPRHFLQRANDYFEAWLDGPPPPPPPLVIDSVDPPEVLSHEPRPLLLRGRHLPQNIHVFFGSIESPHPAVCRPHAGEIDVTTPTGLLGNVEVRVVSVDDPNNQARLVVRFESVEPSRPYRESLDAAKYRKCREDLKAKDRVYTQGYVAQMVGVNTTKMGNFERGGWPAAPDDLFVRLAKLYGQPLSAFLKDQ